MRDKKKKSTFMLGVFKLLSNRSELHSSVLLSLRDTSVCHAHTHTHGFVSD